MAESLSLQQARRQLAALTTDPGYDQSDPLVIAAILGLRTLLGDSSEITKAPCLAAATGNVALTGNQTLDTIACPAGSRVLLANQTAAKENGLWITGAGAWTRASDFADWADIPGTIATVEKGATLGDTVWLCTADPGGTLETDDITFQQQSGAGDVAAEAAARSSADSAEATARANADTTLASAIAAETARAEAAEGAGGGGVASHAAGAVMTPGQAIGSGVPASAAMKFSVEEYDVDACLAGTDHNEYTTPAAGIYEVTIGAMIDKQAWANESQIALWAQIDGTPYAIARVDIPAGANAYVTIRGTKSFSVANGKVITPVVGGNVQAPDTGFSVIDFASWRHLNFFSVKRVG